MVRERVFRDDARVGVVVGEGGDLGCRDVERRGDTRLDSHLDSRGDEGTRA